MKRVFSIGISLMLFGYFCLLLFTTGVEINLLGDTLYMSMAFFPCPILLGPNNKGKGKANPDDFDNENNDQSQQNAGGNTDNLDDESDMSDDEAAVEAALLESKKDSEQNLIGNSSNTKVEDLKSNKNIERGSYLLLDPDSKVRTELKKSRIFDSFYVKQLEMIDATKPDIVPKKEKIDVTEPNIDNTNQTTPQVNDSNSGFVNLLLRLIFGSNIKSNTTKKNGSVDKDNKNNGDDNSDDGDIGGGE